ncbi:hypothetical protein [Photobacterium sanguinicancri]|uniref:SSU ribosomal protein S2p (SAe) n=1 Tax=Photobacterium sanguinicancri TaxID=875932 RepID=A0AAW7Y5H5_9GAMM|nr:hypothetical protein [Photobacterium sanguinicancri]MDO6543876.1 hypothetical protein [Photobacterium sanguinicancri]
MAAMQEQNNMAIHIVEKTMPIDRLVMIMYNSPSEIVYQHFRAVNSHLKDDLVKVGQVVLLSPAESNMCTLEEARFLDIAKSVDRTLIALDRSERETLAKRYDFLSSVASYNGLLLGLSNNAWNAHVSQVKSILKDLEKSYVSSYKSNGNLSNSTFFTKRNMHFQRLDSALSRFGQPKIGGRIIAGDIRKNLGLSSKSIIHHWGSQKGSVTSIPNFSKNYATVANMSRNLKRVGYIGIALTGVDATANIKKACTTKNKAQCSKAKYTQIGKATGSIAGGFVGGGVATWGVCTLVFGLPSGGTSAFWCAVVAGGAGGYVGGNMSGKYGESTGELLYKSYGIK